MPATIAQRAPSKKRKLSSKSATFPSSSSTGKNKSRTRLPANGLQWRKVDTTTEAFAGMDEGGGMMMLEELDDVGVEWEEDDRGGKVARFVSVEGKKVKGKGKAKATDPAEDDEALADEDEALLKADEAVSELQDADVITDVVEEEDEEEAVGELPTFSNLNEDDLNEADDEPDADGLDAPFDDTKLPEWKPIPLHSAIKRALTILNFSKPTDIQKRSLPAGLNGKDVVGVAETGSGKTLAYSLPILSHLLTSPPPSKRSRRALSALILCPTRELALQVVDHLNKLIAQAIPKDKTVGPPRISIGSVVGGLSAQKQKRIVERGADILVATPGRLWDLIKSDEELASGIRGLRFLVIDEADRMIENGHFAELENIVRLTQRAVDKTSGPDDEDPVFAAAESTIAETVAREDMQTFVFSATLSKDLQHNLKQRRKPASKKGGKKATALEDLVAKLDFRDAEPEVIDLSPEGGVVKSLKESMIDCVVSDKDLYLYYFLLRYPGRSLVFVGSIDGIRRLQPLFETLQMPVYPLHSQLQQKQRLKNLDRFKSNPNAILIATDVAARGLDIPHVEHVVHFNLPRTADAYIHRSGRTARAQNPGFALQLCAPEDKGIQRALMKSLGRDFEVPELPIEAGFIPKLKERVRVARDIEKAQHNVKKLNHERNWLQEAAEALDVDVDPSMLSDSDDPDAPTHHRKKAKPLNGKQQSSEKSAKVMSLKNELRHLLSQPLMARGVSAKYPTSGSKIIVDDLLSSKGHPTMLGAGSNKAYDEVLQATKRKIGGGKRKRPAPVKA